MAEYDIIRYTPSMKKEWDAFVRESKNGTFLLCRDYMEYHSDRFEDHSLIFTRDGKINALFPACSVSDGIASHSGLTYGGLVAGRKTTATEALIFYSSLAGMMTREGASSIIVKPVPHIYHSLPCEEELYALFRLNAKLSVRNISSAILMADRIRFRDIRKSGVRKAAKAGLRVEESSDLASFWKILTDNLAARHNVAPVHSLSEIERLKTLFPKEIRLFAVFAGKEIVGGTLIYETPLVAHAQYISSSPEGKSCGALDMLFAVLLDDIYKEKKYFDFGISNENRGMVLNEDLIYQKEGFGGRGICYDTYSIAL